MADRTPTLVDQAIARLDDLAALPDVAELRRRVVEVVGVVAPLLDEPGRAAAVDAVVAQLRGLGPLDELLRVPEITDVLVNADGSVWTERSGELVCEPIELTADERAAIIERVVHPLGLRADRAHPIVDARLADGSRVNAVLPPVSVDGPCLSIRRFGAAVLPLDAFCTPPVAALLRRAVEARCNIVISGGTGAGKTTLLNALAAHIPPGERLVTIEDAAELRLGRAHVVRLEARPANAEGVGAVAIRDLVRTALRMRPDRIVVGEARGPEALDMLQAMNTGHEGSLSTCHANSPIDALRRLETMVLTAAVDLPSAVVREQLAAAIDVVVQLERRAGRRLVVAVDEVMPPDHHEAPSLHTCTLIGDDGSPVGCSIRRARGGPHRPWWVR